MIPGGKVFDSSLEKGVPYIFRVGADQVGHYTVHLI
jgi:peptidylprolyl isomerase